MLLALAAGLPATIVAVVLLWRGDFAPRVVIAVKLFQFAVQRSFQDVPGTTKNGSRSGKKSERTKSKREIGRIVSGSGNHVDGKAVNDRPIK